MGLSLDGRANAGALLVEVELHVAAGETLAVLGPNGAGKTSLLHVLCGLLPLTAGDLVLDGRVLDAPARGTFVRAEDRSVGMLFQDLLLFPNLDVTDNVAFGLRAAGMAKAEARATALGWLDRLALGHRAGARVTSLSGGEAQRVALARALAPAPRVLLLDEPLSALDADVRATVRRQLRDHLNEHDGPRVLVTHDPLDAAVLADRVVVLETGMITAAGRLPDLVARPRTVWGAELAGTNLLPARAAATALTLAGGATLTAAEAPGDGAVLVAIRPAAIALHTRRPAGSPRNVWEATVAGVEGFGERVRVRLDGPVPVVAEVTVAGLAALRAKPGSKIWASVKATELAAYPA
jgi:molybdate transport system ATP-binding protein